MDRKQRLSYNQNMEKKNINKSITAILIVLNIVVFLGLSVLGDPSDGEFLLKYGAMYEPYVMTDGEFYRLFTSMFLHFDFYHLMNNMIMLGALGVNMEPVLGSIKLLIIYLLSGLGGNILSMWMNMRVGSLFISAGASGAVYGLVGAMVWVVLRNRGHLGRIYGQRICVMLLLMFYFGYISTGIDNYAHAGGFIVGFVVTVLLYRKSQGIKMEG